MTTIIFFPAKTKRVLDILSLTSMAISGSDFLFVGEMISKCKYLPLFCHSGKDIINQ